MLLCALVTKHGGLRLLSSRSLGAHPQLYRVSALACLQGIADHQVCSGVHCYITVAGELLGGANQLDTHAAPLQHHLQGVIEEVREDNVIRSVREDSESSCVGEIAFFMGIAQPRTFQVS